MIAAGLHGLATAGVERDGIAIVEHFISHLRQQPIALGMNGSRHLLRQPSGVGAIESEALARVGIGVDAKISAEMPMWSHGGIHQHRRQRVTLSQHRRFILYNCSWV